MQLLLEKEATNAFGIEQGREKEVEEASLSVQKPLCGAKRSRFEDVLAKLP
jgi:hypothetical protein